MTELTQADYAARAAALAAKVSQDVPHPESWMPDDAAKGHAPVLVGVLEDFDSYHHPRWGERKIAVLRDGEGKLWSVWLIHRVLADEFARRNPQLGDLLAISYKGVVSKPGQAAYVKYAVAVERQDRQVDWTSHARTDGTDAAQLDTDADRNDHVAAPASQVVEHDPDVERALAGEPVACRACGLLNGYHSEVCPLRNGGQTDDIPF